MTQELTVEQCDRDAAANQLNGSLQWWNCLPVKRGEHDSHPLVQAFARHRTEALAASDKGEVEALDVLSGLSSYLGAGLGDDATTAEQFDARIRWGIDHWTCAVFQRCADVVEECSKRPNTRWGEVKKRILALKPEYEASITATRAREALSSLPQGEEG